MMIISRTPMRISFFGGGTDIPTWYRNHGGGAVLSTAIDKYIYVSVNKKFDGQVRASYSRTENVPGADHLEHELIRNAMIEAGIMRGLEVVTVSDLPAGTGTGSSSSYTVGLLNAMYKWTGLPASPERLAQDACTIEINRCGKLIGKQDQYIAAYGGVRYIEFLPHGGVTVKSPKVSMEKVVDLSKMLLLFYKGKRLSHESGQIFTSIRSRIRQKDRDTLEALRLLRMFAAQGLMYLEEGNLIAFGALLDEAWTWKKKLTMGISSVVLDDHYREALKAGALGGKLLGAGGTGFLLLCCTEDCRENVIRAMLEQGLTLVPFSMCVKGSKIIYDGKGEK